MIEFQLPKHASHSAINNYIRCGKAYELGKLGVEESPAWWLLGGSAVHKATEWLDKGEWDDAPEMAFYKAFQDEIVKTEQTHPDHSTWRKAGYGARAQGYEHWMEQGPRYVKQWADRGGMSQYQCLVEWDISRTLPSGIHIKAYLDRAWKMGKTGWQIADLKTGSTRPDSDQQLGIYKALFSAWLNDHNKPRDFSEEDILAYNYMFKDDEFYPMDVSNWTLDTVDKIAKEWYDGIKSSVFLPNRGKQCGTCGLRDACYLASGDTELSRQFDRLNPNYEG